MPKHKFIEMYQFDFLDLDEPGLVDSRDEALEEFQITQEQADELVKILQSALERDMNVIVHCHAGVCRSGAVAEVGVMMGFEDTGARRQPNVLVSGWGIWTF